MSFYKSRSIKLLGKKFNLPDQRLKVGSERLVYFSLLPSESNVQPEGFQGMFRLSIENDTLKLTDLEGQMCGRTNIFTRDEVNGSRLNGMLDSDRGPLSISWRYGKER